MPENIIERNDIASAKAEGRNAAFFPPVIASIQDSFGAKEIPIFIYNVSRVEFNSPRPPNHPHMLIRACEEGKEYAQVGTISHPFHEVKYDENGNKEIRLTDGYKEATKMLSPMNPGTDQNFSAPDAFNVGGNLNDYGCFWSINYELDDKGKLVGVPLPSEVMAARKRMEKTYKAELEKLASVESKNPEDARALANNISHAAADYYGVSTSWHRTDLIPKAKAGNIDCPNCAEKIAATAAMCRHCDAVINDEKARKLFPQKFAPKVGRPANVA